MKAPVKIRELPLLAIGTGVICSVLRFLMYSFGTDSRGLMKSPNFLHIACLAIAFALAVFTGLSLWKAPDSALRRGKYSSGKQWTAVAILIPVWFLASAFTSLDQITDRLTLIRAVLSFAVVPCFAVSCWCRIQGKRPLFLLHGIICVFFMVDMICRYRPWSGNPQLADYTFHLFACIFLVLTTYYLAAADAGLPSPRMLRFFALMALFFCTGALIGPEDIKFYLGGVLWAFFSTCPVMPVSRKSQNLPHKEG